MASEKGDAEGVLKKFTSRLDSPELEHRFREEGLSRDTAVALGLMLFSLLFHILSYPTDLLLLGRSEQFFLVAMVRGGSALIALVGVFVLRRRPNDFHFFDNVVFLWSSLLVFGIVAANALLPADYTTHVAWDVFLTLAVYAVLPLPLVKQVTVASIITIGDILLFLLHKSVEHPVAFSDLVAAFICANLVGIFASWEQQRWRRREFLALRREADAKDDLQQVLLEMKTLKGIIPICSSCKRVRTDEGHWDQVEAYLSQHSDADFSHGICPECTRKLYPDYTVEDD